MAVAVRPLDRLFEGLTLLVLVSALILGGATQEGFLVQAGVRLASLPLFFWAAWRVFDLKPRGLTLWPLALLVLVLLVPALQLIPLPPGLWAHLPGRADYAATYHVAGLAEPWLPLSLTPDATWDAGLALLPPASLFLATISLREQARGRLAIAVLVVIAASLGLGLLQMAAGPQTPLRPYVRTNVEYGVGFFANRNHQASLLLAALPLAAHFIGARRGDDARWTLAPVLFGAAVCVTAAVGVVAAGSRAGLLLLGPTALASLLIAARTERFEVKWVAFGGAVLAVILAAAIFVDPGGGVGKLSRPIGPEARIDSAPAIFHAAAIYAPLGSGLGSFDPVYRTVEPLSSVGTSYLNHAHDDYLELWLETGVAGLLLILAFYYWFVRATWRAWVSERRLVGAGLARAGSVVAGVLVLHSVVDYPLRTTALATLFGFALGLLIPPKTDRILAEAWPPKPVRPPETDLAPADLPV
jgi:O-antigen ligase